MEKTPLFGGGHGDGRGDVQIYISSANCQKALPRAGRNVLATIGHGVEIRRSTIRGAGNGLFADRDFKKGEQGGQQEGWATKLRTRLSH